MKNLLPLLLLCAGCQSARQNIGRPIASAGENIGRYSTIAMVGMAAFWPLIPIGIAIGLPGIILGAPLYCGGNWLAGNEIGNYCEM